MIRQTYAQVNLDSFKRNVSALRGVIGNGVKLMAVVKADAYGHGLVQIAHAAAQAGADLLGVALVEEGIVLRQSEICLPILVLAGQNREGTRLAIEHDLTLTAFTPDHLAFAQEAALLSGQVAEIHLKLDTGMNRIGLKSDDELRKFLDLLQNMPMVRLSGAFTHFACADSEDQSFTELQMARFKEMAALLPAEILLHAEGTSAILKRPDARFNMVRAGLALYGYSPVDTDIRLEPVLSWMAEITHVKAIASGESVSYGANFTAEKETAVATIAVGYGDGYNRLLSCKAQVLINGCRCTVLGRVCMDQIMVDVSHAGKVNPGDQAVLIGTQGEESVLADELARLLGTIPYEVLLSISKRVPRIYPEQ